jgi:hypothetical protein
LDSIVSPFFISEPRYSLHCSSLNIALIHYLGAGCLLASDRNKDRSDSLIPVPIVYSYIKCTLISYSWREKLRASGDPETNVGSIYVTAAGYAIIPVK